MSNGPLAFSAKDLPATLPVFPLSGVLLLPRGRLPLNIFEPRYLAMTSDALASKSRLIGMIQPVDPHAKRHDPEIYRVGCAGRISSFSETDDGRYLITLTGCCRFQVAGELPSTRGYRMVEANWDGFAGDLDEPAEVRLDRPRLLTGLKDYFKQHGIAANWEAIEQTPDERLVTSLAMICPFEPSEKQALLEADDLPARSALMTALIETAVMEKAGDGETARH